MAEILERLEHGGGRSADLDLLLDLADNILGRSFCPLGDAAAMPVQGFLKHFRDEFEAHVRDGRCPANRRRESLGRPAVASPAEVGTPTAGARA